MRLFDYNSKPMSLLNKLSDLLFLNVLFVVFCLPVVTIGASQAGLYTAVKVLQDKEDDSSCLKAFFRGFAAGFWRITLVWCVYLTLLLLFGGNLLRFSLNNTADKTTWIFMAALLLLAIFEPLSVQFHARFVCTIWKLFSNAFLFFLGNPIRALLVAVLTWMPIVLVFVLGEHLLGVVPVFILVYFSLAYLMCFLLLSKPFSSLTKSE